LKRVNQNEDGVSFRSLNADETDDAKHLQCVASVTLSNGLATGSLRFLGQWQNGAELTAVHDLRVLRGNRMAEELGAGTN